MKTFNKEVMGECVIKKSRFIAIGRHIGGEADFEAFIADVRGRYSDARHIAYAYRFTLDNQVYQKSSDDGEPSGTAGKPILNIILADDLMDVAVAVVRYFGGIKLGASGLIRAYGGSAKLLREFYEEITKSIKVVCELKFADRLIRYLDSLGVVYTKSFGQEFEAQIELGSNQNLDTLPDFCRVIT